MLLTLDTVVVDSRTAPAVGDRDRRHAAQRIAAIGGAGGHDFRAGWRDDGRDALSVPSLPAAGRRGSREPEPVDNALGRAAAPPLRQQLWALRPGLDGGVPAVHTFPRLKPGEKRRRLETLCRQNRALDRAYQSKEYLATILEQATPDEASDLLDEVAGVGGAVPLGAVRQAGADRPQARRRHPGLPRHQDERARGGHQQQATGHCTAGVRLSLSRRAHLLAPPLPTVI